jgi:hypothetical protein
VTETPSLSISKTSEVGKTHISLSTRNGCIRLLDRENGGVAWEIPGAGILGISLFYRIGEENYMVPRYRDFLCFAWTRKGVNCRVQSIFWSAKGEGERGTAYLGFEYSEEEYGSRSLDSPLLDR